MSSTSRDILPITRIPPTRSFANLLTPVIVGLVVMEAALFVASAHFLPWQVIAAVVGSTALLGAIILVWAILRFGNEIAARLDRDEGLDDRCIGGLLMMAAGMLLLLPGLLSDILGLVLLMRPTRRFLTAAIRRHFRGPVASGSATLVSFPGASHEADEDESLDEIDAGSNAAAACHPCVGPRRIAATS